MTLKLTPAQTVLMETFDPVDELSPSTYWECAPEELRVARACAKKGLLSIDGEPGRGEHFQICLTPLGISVARCLLDKRNRDAAA